MFYRGLLANLWLQISMTDLALVQDDKAFENLGCDLFGLHLARILCHVVAEIAVLDKLHRDVDGISIWIFKPAEKQNE